MKMGDVGKRFFLEFVQMTYFFNLHDRPFSFLLNTVTTIRMHNPTNFH